MPVDELFDVGQPTLEDQVAVMRLALGDLVVHRRE